MKFRERVDKSDEILLHTIIDFEMVFLDLGDNVLDHLDNICAKSHWRLIRILIGILLS